jgi:hypothetical protein
MVKVVVKVEDVVVVEDVVIIAVTVKVVATVLPVKGDAAALVTVNFVNPVRIGTAQPAKRTKSFLPSSPFSL